MLRARAWTLCVCDSHIERGAIRHFFKIVLDWRTTVTSQAVSQQHMMIMQADFNNML